MAHKITDDELLARVDQEMRSAQDYMGGKLASQRKKALQYYLAQAEGDLAPPEVEGRSSVVSTDVADTVEWMLPSLLRIFTSSDRVVQLNPRKPGMEQVAEDATDYLNWIFSTQNDGFRCLYTMFKDALISKTGVLKIWWEEKADEAREEYEGLSETELMQLLQDDEVKPIEHAMRPDPESQKQKEAALAQIASQQPMDPQQAQMLAQQQAHIEAQPIPMLHDVTVLRVRKAAGIKIEPVPPEEFFISRQAKTIADAPFIAHVREWLVSDLRANSYRIADDDLPSDDGMVGSSMERSQRWSFDDATDPYPQMFEPPSDPSMRRVWVVEAYLRADVDGDGIAEWRRLLKCGQKILDNVECDGPPFAAVTPLPLPHRFFGQSVADLAMESQRQKTAMLRAVLDNMYLQVNGRYFAVNGQVNLDDLLTSRPGGVVRVQSPGAVGPLQQGMADMGSASTVLEYLETQKENRTGFTRYSNGADANSLNKTATGVSIVTNRADMRQELIARVFAETGVKDLFVRMLSLVCRYQQQPAEFRLNGRWLTIDPREWRNQFDVVVNVGLGTNDQAQKLAHIMQLMQVQQQLAAAGTGIVTPVEAYNSAAELVKALGYKDAGRFVKNPQESPPPQKPGPEEVKAQAAMQIEQAKLAANSQIEQMRRDHEMAIEQAKMRMQADVDVNRQAAEAQQKALEAQQQAMLEAQKIEFERWREQLRAETQIIVAGMGKQQDVDGVDTGEAKELDDGPDSNQALALAMQGFAAALDRIGKPRMVVRGPDGRIAGVE